MLKQQLKKYPDSESKYGYKWLIEPDLETVVQKLQNPMIIDDPVNISAAIDYRRDRKKYLEKNRQIQKVLSGHKECPVCFSDFHDPKNTRFMCYNLHWICKECFYSNKIEKCVLCRFKYRAQWQTFSDVKKCINCRVKGACFMVKNDEKKQFCSRLCARNYDKKKINSPVFNKLGSKFNLSIYSSDVNFFISTFFTS